jgi:hypothetical protein
MPESALAGFWFWSIDAGTRTMDFLQPLGCSEELEQLILEGEDRQGDKVACK